MPDDVPKMGVGACTVLLLKDILIFMPRRVSVRIEFRLIVLPTAYHCISDSKLR